MIFSPTRMYEYRDYLTEVDEELSTLAWLYHMNHGIFMTPGVEEEWTLSIAHTDEDLQRYLDAFEAFARDVTPRLSRPRRPSAQRRLGDVDRAARGGSPGPCRRRTRAASRAVASSWTYSAIVVLPRPRAIWTIACTVSWSASLLGMSRTKEPSILIRSKGMLLQVVEGAEAGAVVVDRDLAAELGEAVGEAGRRFVVVDAAPSR